MSEINNLSDGTTKAGVAVNNSANGESKIDIKSFRVLFTDMDGTLLNSAGEVSHATRDALTAWTKSGRRLVIASSRGPSGILPTIGKNNFRCGMIALGGALIVDERGKTLFKTGMSVEQTRRIVDFIEAQKFNTTWSIYTADRWIVKSHSVRIQNEERIVGTLAEEGTANSLNDSEEVGKILCKGATHDIDKIAELVKGAFPQMNIAKSWETALEINPPGVDKGSALKKFCELNDVPLEQTIAFGDNWNDVAMLDCAGLAVLMGNAPQELKARFAHVTADHDHDGIAQFLSDALFDKN